MPTGRIRDLIYFDFDKAMSLWSQFEGGRLEQVSTLSEESERVGAGATAGIANLLQVRLGAQSSGRNLKEETKVVHHDLLAKVERLLGGAGLLADLTEFDAPDPGDIESIQTRIGDCPYLKTEGRSVIEDYRRFTAISEKFNDITGFIAQSGENSVKKSGPYLEVLDTLEQKKNEISKIKDRNEKTRRKQEIRRLGKKLEALAKPDLEPVEDWILDGTRLWIRTFMPNRINFRIYPYEGCPSFQVLCNLKRECFIDEDLQHLLYGYGQRPNVPLTVTGLVTSRPPKGGYEFDPLEEFEGFDEDDDSDESNEKNQKVVELAFRRVFAALEGMEDFVRYSRYPNVTVHPIAVYRDLRYEVNEEGAS